MGRIKHTYIKRIGDRLIEDFGEEFTADFEKNKKKVAEHSTVEGKVIRNRIAGHITRVMKQKASGE